MFQSGISPDDDMDLYFDLFERLGLIYIARNRGTMTFYKNRFWRNVGTFGGAITIDSPDWAKGNKPYVIISGCTFDTNMAYFSGNAVYIRNTIKNTTRTPLVCAGVYIETSIFEDNIGLKAHNGGAIGGVC